MYGFRQCRFFRDDTVIQLSARITDEGCKHLVFSELLQFNQELGVIESDGQCDRCMGASDCMAVVWSSMLQMCI